MSLWWLQPGWKQTQCAECGKTIWPEGDPDWGYCYECFSERLRQERSYPERPDPEQPEPDFPEESHHA